MGLLKILTVIFKQKNKIIINFLVIVTVVTGGTFLQKPVFEAKSSLLVKMLKEDTARPGMGLVNNNMPLVLSQDEVITTEIQILTGRELIEKILTVLNVESVYPGLVKGQSSKAGVMDQAVRTFGKNLKVAGVKKSNVITVSFQHNNPEIAARAVNLLMEAFKDKHLALHSDPQSSFIESQLSSFENKLRTSERKLQEYQQSNSAFALEEQRSLLLKQRTDFDSAYKMTSDNVGENLKRIASIKAQMKYVTNNNSRYTPTDRDRIITDAKAKLLDLQLKEQELSRKYTDNNHLVLDAKKEVETVNRFLREQEEGIAGKVKTGNPVYQNMEMELFRAEADLNSQAAKADALKVQLRHLDKKIAALDMSESNVQNLKREVEINEKNFKTYAERHEDARISDAMNKLKLSNISVIQAAAVPVKPIKPNKMLNILIGGLLGMISALSYAFLSENFGQTFSDPESVERYLGLPVLLTVPRKED